MKKEQKEEMLPQLMQQLYGADAGQTQHRGGSIGMPHGGNPAVEAAMKAQLQQLQTTLGQMAKQGGAAANAGAGAGRGAAKGRDRTPGLGLIDGGTVAPQLAGIKIFKPTRALTAKQGMGLNSPVDVGFPHTCLLRL